MAEPPTPEEARALYRFMVDLAERAGIDAHLEAIKAAPEGLDVALTRLHYFAFRPDEPPPPDGKWKWTASELRERMRALEFTCPQCGRTSYNVNDRAQGYCGACHVFPTKPGPTARAMKQMLDRWAAKGDGEELALASEMITNLVAALEQVESAASRNEAQEIATEALALFEGR